MHRDNRLGAIGHGPLDEIDVHVVIDRINIHKNGCGPRVDDRKGGCRESISLATFDFVDRKSVAKYNSKGNNQAKKLKSEQDKRCKAVRDEAVKVKDKVILEGSEAAVVLLEKFAKKKF